MSDHSGYELTYHQGRKCLHDGEPIPDQAYASRIFCEPFEREDGSIQDCKGAYYTAKRKIEMEPYTLISFLHRNITRRIKELYAEKGELVDLEDINQFGIPLDKPLKLERAPSGLFTFYFKLFGFQHIASSKFKIFSHEVL